MSPRASAPDAHRQMEREARYGQKPPVGDTLNGVVSVYRLGSDEIRDIAVRVACLTLRHPCELDPADGITVCGHPDHRRDRERLAERLEAVGLVETQAPKARTVSGKTSHGRGTCPWCLRSIQIGATGLILSHRRQGKNSAVTCPGVGKEPKAAEASLADDPGSGKTTVEVTL